MSDIAVLAPSQLARASVEQFRQGQIHAPIVIEMGLDYGWQHLGHDLGKFRNSGVPHAYVVHFSRRPSSNIEELLTGAHPDIKTAYAQIPPTGFKAVKHLTDVSVASI